MKIEFKEDYIIDVTLDFSPMRKDTFDITKKVELEGRELSDATYKKNKDLGKFGHRQVPLTDEERVVERTFTYKRLFSKGDVFKMKPGINILVGDNGCGKSTLIREFLKANPVKDVLMIDMEKANPTISRPDPEHGITYTPEEILTQFMWSVESHGETREGVLNGVLQLNAELYILDEPEQGLSLKNQKKYLDKLKALGKNMIIITHSKVFVENVHSVFDVESMQWVSSEKYLKNL